MSIDYEKFIERCKSDYIMLNADKLLDSAAKVTVELCDELDNSELVLAFGIFTAKLCDELFKPDKEKSNGD